MKLAKQQGSELGEATIEFVAVVLLVVIPAIYLVITVLTLVAASFSAAGAANQAVRIMIADPNARSAANYAAALTFNDQRLSGTTGVQIKCGGECKPRATVNVTVLHNQPLPGIPQWLAGSTNLQIPVTAHRSGIIYGDER